MDSLCAITLLVLKLYMASTRPLPSTCQGEYMDGHYLFKLPSHMAENIRSSMCELQITIEGFNRAIYANGKAPESDQVQLPVLKATMEDFTLTTCPSSTVLDIDCPRGPVFQPIPCSCVNSTVQETTSPAQFRGHTAKADESQRVYVIPVIVATLAAILIVGFTIYHCRKTALHHCHGQNMAPI